MRSGLGKAPFQYWWHGDSKWGTYKPWYSYSRTMEGKSSGNPRKIPPVVDRYCPHCHTNNASLRQELDDLYCFVCGYRWSFYFKPKVDKWINWIEMMERKYGAPILLSDKEHKGKCHYTLAQSHEYAVNHRKEMAARSRNYRATHKEEVAIQNRQYFLNHRDAIYKRRKELRVLTANISRQERMIKGGEKNVE